MNNANVKYFVLNIVIVLPINALKGLGDVIAKIDAHQMADALVEKIIWNVILWFVNAVVLILVLFVPTPKF